MEGGLSSLVEFLRQEGRKEEAQRIRPKAQHHTLAPHRLHPSHPRERFCERLGFQPSAGWTLWTLRRVRLPDFAAEGEHQFYHQGAGGEGNHDRLQRMAEQQVRTERLSKRVDGRSTRLSNASNNA